ncbi:MAG: hypothetical protein U1D30_03890 [Planctomycetota bacterium]
MLIWAFTWTHSKTSLAAEDHDHPHEGPNGGSLIGTGDEEYHAEILHDDKSNTVTIHLLDSKAKQAVPIESKEVAINVKGKGKPRQFKLKAMPIDKDPKGRSSRFLIKDKDLCSLLDDHNAQAWLRTSIAGKSFTGKIEHDHDHDHK